MIAVTERRRPSRPSVVTSGIAGMIARKPVRTTVRMTVPLAAAALLVALGRPAAAAPLPDPPATAAPEALPPAVAGPAAGHRFKGTDFCVRCHRSEQGDWVDASTTAVWRHDAHSRAHLALLPDNPRTKAMEAALGITAARTAACVACHSHAPDEPAVEEESSVAHAGIGCESCHGAGSDYFEPHMEKRWRFLSSAEKEALGMHDLRNPVAKAENCLSCHVGEVAAGKIVTHAMYAAGHPPLPAFEMESFGRALGPHWKRVWEKKPAVQELAARAAYRTEARSEAQRSLIGALVALERSAGLAQSYAAAAAADPRGLAWPELSLYDCQACHHDLAVPSARQAAGYGGLVPGRPSLFRWPRALAGVAFARAGMPTDVDLLMAPSRDALSERPFGTAAAVRDAADPRRQIGAAIAVLAAAPRDEGLAAAERETAAALARAGGTSGDFESARQIGWVLAPLLDGGRLDGAPAADAAVAKRLRATLALDFPTPAYPEPGSAAKPFWETSLSAAAAAHVEDIRAAFPAPAPAR